MLLLREYDIYRLKIVTVNSSGRQLFKIVKVDVRRVRRPPQPPQRGSSLPQRLRIVMSDEGSSS